MKTHTYTHIQSGKPQETRGKAVFVDSNGNTVSSHKPSKRELKRLKIDYDITGLKNTQNQVLLLVATLSALGIAVLYLTT